MNQVTNVNKYGVPHRRYLLSLADGTSRTLDIRRTDIPVRSSPQPFARLARTGMSVLPLIVRVTDLATGRTYRNLHHRATHRVWCYAKEYAA